MTHLAGQHPQVSWLTCVCVWLDIVQTMLQVSAFYRWCSSAVCFLGYRQGMMSCCSSRCRDCLSLACTAYVQLILQSVTEALWIICLQYMIQMLLMPCLGMCTPSLSATTLHTGFVSLHHNRPGTCLISVGTRSLLDLWPRSYTLAQPAVMDAVMSNRPSVTICGPISLPCEGRS